MNSNNRERFSLLKNAVAKARRGKDVVVFIKQMSYFNEAFKPMLYKNFDVEDLKIDSSQSKIIFDNGSEIKFVSFDKSDKIKGGNAYPMIDNCGTDFSTVGSDFWTNYDLLHYRYNYDLKQQE